MVLRKTTAPNFFRFWSVNADASSVCSGVKPCVAPSSAIALAPVSIDWCRKAAVLEKMRTRVPAGALGATQAEAEAEAEAAGAGDRATSPADSWRVVSCDGFWQAAQSAVSATVL